ncbi:MAG: tRNA uridine-5-carboxymethylaminomethyl(34) synthesis enzyme MnmG [Firmicutes bacterium]|nr:tRNA uridine-5-carboxymethylaminomethyl(34) synthesis enzyme MnmG [Bacillota bacterium]
MTQGQEYDVIVVGAGHAGCEAALASARMGLATLLLSMNLENIAQLACNPAIGGPAKGHLVREIDALGGEMGRNTDRSRLQIRVLNTAKGPAVRVLRAQVDRHRYQWEMRKVLESQENLDLRQGMVASLLLEGQAVVGVRVKTGLSFRAKAVVLATGVYLNAEIYLGEVKYAGGPGGQLSAGELSQCLQDLGFEMGRFRTTSPPRVAGDTVDFSRMVEQPGSSEPLYFSLEPVPFEPGGEQLSCYLTHTTEETHRIIRENLDRSPFRLQPLLGAEPRYCPSIEDKVVRFADRTSHQLFLEPEGWETKEYYVMGLFTSMAEDVQLEILRTIPGLERVGLVRPGYGIEYDYLYPTQLELSLRVKGIAGLYCAGQINGTSGYEEAAAQGLMAGINAGLYVQGREPFILDRSQAYIGVLVDDLVLKGVAEPYRMLTSRAEYRLLLRMDNADLRLTEKGHELGLIGEERYKAFVQKRAALKGAIAQLKAGQITPTQETGRALERLGLSPIRRNMSLAELLRRPEMTYGLLKELADLPDLEPAVREQVEIQIKYEGYIQKQEEQVARFRRLERRHIPAHLDYEGIPGLSQEGRDKMQRLRPRSLGQASRISGVTPADISVLMVYLKKMG